MARGNGLKHPSLLIEDADLRWCNFKGEKKQYNKAGDRNFVIIIKDPDEAAQYKSEGWNLSLNKKRDPDDPDEWKLKVKVNFDYYDPPKIFMISSRSGKKTRLNEDTVECLDYADIVTADVELDPYDWENAEGDSGITAYLKTAYVTIEEDPFAHKYDMDEEPPWN